MNKGKHASGEGKSGDGDPVVPTTGTTGDAGWHRLLASVGIPAEVVPLATLTEQQAIAQVVKALSTGGDRGWLWLRAGDDLCDQVWARWDAEENLEDQIRITVMHGHPLLTGTNEVAGGGVLDAPDGPAALRSCAAQVVGLLAEHIRGK